MDAGLNKKNNTKVFLAESLRSLIQRMPFQSITIKKICDEAGVVRVTFYNYFIDKYDALDYLIQTDLTQDLIIDEKDPVKSVLQHIASVLFKHRRFYQIASEIDGQNGFQEIFVLRLKEVLLKVLNNHRNNRLETQEIDNDLLAETYAVMIFYLVIRWLKGSSFVSENDFLKAAVLMSHSCIYDFVQ